MRKKARRTGIRELESDHELVLPDPAEYEPNRWQKKGFLRKFKLESSAKALVFSPCRGDNGNQIKRAGCILKAGRAHMLRLMPVIWALTFAAASHAGTLNARVATPDGTPLPSAVVTAIPLGQNAIPAKAGTKTVMVQQDKQFMPFVLPIQLGTTVEFPNHDPFRHQVYSFSPAKTFELKLYGGSVVSTVVFDKEGVVPLGCNIHDNMLAYIYVVGTPYFAATENTGEGKINQLPAGSYAIKVWHPNQKAGQGEVGNIEVTATSTADITVQIELKRGRTQRKPGAIDETYN